MVGLLFLLWITVIIAPGLWITGILVSIGIVMVRKKRPKNMRQRRIILVSFAVISVICLLMNYAYHKSIEPDFSNYDRMRQEEKEALAKSITFPLYASGELQGESPDYRLRKGVESGYLATTYGSTLSYPLSIYQYASGSQPPPQAKAIEEACQLSTARNSCDKVKDTQFGELYKVDLSNDDKFYYFIRGPESHMVFRSKTYFNIDELLGTFKTQDVSSFIDY